jgi:hypothetical protein
MSACEGLLDDSVPPTTMVELGLRDGAFAAETFPKELTGLYPSVNAPELEVSSCCEKFPEAV